MKILAKKKQKEKVPLKNKQNLKSLNKKLTQTKLIY